MKDLFVLTADSDAEAVMRSILVRHKALGIRPIEAKVMRFAGRDSGMVKEGPEIARALVKKSEYSHLILLWDHHGSGWDNRASEWALDAIQQRLDGVTWAGRSAAIVAVPELKNGSVAANRRWQSTLGYAYCSQCTGRSVSGETQRIERAALPGSSERAF